MESIKDLSSIPSEVGVGDMKVSVGLFLRKGAESEEPGFPGSRAKTGILMAKVGHSGTMNDYARSFIELNPGLVKEFRVVRNPGLTTTAMFWVQTKCPCKNEQGQAVPERVLKPREIFALAKERGINGKSAVDILNRNRTCPVCGQGTLEDWKQLDPTSEKSLSFFDERNADGELVGRTGEECLKELIQRMDSAQAAFRIPGVVALSRYGLEGERVPDAPVYHAIQEWAHAHIGKDGRSEPLRVDLLNNLQDGADVNRLILAAEEYTVGTVDFDWLDKGFTSDPALPYKVKLQVFLQHALKGEEPLLKSRSWAVAKRKTAKLRDTLAEF